MSYAAAPEHFRRDDRPPIEMEAAPPPGAADSSRPTVTMRPWINPGEWHDPLADLGYPPEHPYVRRYWVAAIGPAAVADLLRLAVAARRGRALPRPLHLPTLARNELVRTVQGGRILVRAKIPPLPAVHAKRLPPFLREEHRRLRWERPHRPG